MSCVITSCTQVGWCGDYAHVNSSIPQYRLIWRTLFHTDQSIHSLAAAWHIQADAMPGKPDRDTGTHIYTTAQPQSENRFMTRGAISFSASFLTDIFLIKSRGLLHMCRCKNCKLPCCQSKPDTGESVLKIIPLEPKNFVLKNKSPVEGNAERPDPGTNFQNTCSAPESVESKACTRHNSGYGNQAGRRPPRELSQLRENPEHKQLRAKAKRGTGNTKGRILPRTAPSHHTTPLHRLGELDLVTVTGSTCSDTRSARCCPDSAVAAPVRNILTAASWKKCLAMHLPWEEVPRSSISPELAPSPHGRIVSTRMCICLHFLRPPADDVPEGTRVCRNN